MNCRGCANSEIKTPQMYSGGYTDDLRVVLAHIQKRLAPNTPLVGIGFSLGSNILVKVLKNALIQMWMIRCLYIYIYIFSILGRKAKRHH